MSSETKEMSEPRHETRLELHIQQSEGGQVAATVPVRWCVSRGLIDNLRERGFVRPKLVLFVRAPQQETVAGETLNVMREVSFRAEPLNRELTFISFRRPGLNEIRTVIIDGAEENAVRKLREFQLLRYFDVFDEDGSLTWGFKNSFGKYIELHNQLDVYVPAEMFAKTPPEWQRKLVKRFYPNQEVDQCSLRRRTIASVVWAALLLTFGQLYKLLSVAGALILGGRKIAWKQLLSPWKAELNSPVRQCMNNGSFWFLDRNGNWRPSPLWLVNPFVLTIAPAVAYGFIQVQAHTYQGRGGGAKALASQLTYPGWFDTWWMSALAIVCLAVALTVLLIGAAGFYNVCDALWSHYTQSPSRRQRRLAQEELEQARKERQKAALQGRILSSLEAMTCETASAKASLEALPASKRTVYLRYLDLKSEVCKPFAR